MLLRIGLLVALTVVAVLVALILQRRRPEPPSSPSYRSIAEIDRSEFAHPDEPLLVVMFGSTTCRTCPLVWDVIESLDVPAERVDVEDDPQRHQRYRIDGVPTTVVVERTGVVRTTFFGPLSRAQLEETLGGP
ncbi:MAG: thioredoxin family protein [Acidimicrobiales bacterium]|nr:thioredoxin family protein [Acidimicrobiales bacterium]